jgi:hypothetical protein
MKSMTLKSLLGTLALLSAPSALAGLERSQPLFQAALATARAPGGAGGASVEREELQDALGGFIAYDDGTVDAPERAYLLGQSSNPAFFTGFTVDAQRYFTQFMELNDAATTPASLGAYPAKKTPEEAFGAGSLFIHRAQVLEGFIPYGTGGVANQLTLRTTYASSFEITGMGTFEPITEAQLREALSQRLIGTYATPREIEQAVLYIREIYKNSQRLYLASWKNEYGRGAPGDLGGFVVAAVSSDRRYVRFVEVQTWVE